MNDSKVVLWRDPLFFSALGAALLFWLILFAIARPAPNLAWPLHAPVLFVFPALLYPGNLRGTYWGELLELIGAGHRFMCFVVVVSGFLRRGTGWIKPRNLFCRTNAEPSVAIRPELT